MRCRVVIGMAAVAAYAALLSGASAAEAERGALLVVALRPRDVPRAPQRRSPAWAPSTWGGYAEFLSMSCGSAGGGSYTDNSGLGQVFVASERKGIYRRGGPRHCVLNPRGHIGITSVSYH
jgi:hypothetical protein